MSNYNALDDVLTNGTGHTNSLKDLERQLNEKKQPRRKHWLETAMPFFVAISLGAGWYGHGKWADRHADSVIQKAIANAEATAEAKIKEAEAREAYLRGWVTLIEIPELVKQTAMAVAAENQNPTSLLVRRYINEAIERHNLPVKQFDLEKPVIPTKPTATNEVVQFVQEAQPDA